MAQTIGFWSSAKRGQTRKTDGLPYLRRVDMHEMGVANSILEAVHKELHLYPGQRAFRVGVRIGEFAGVDTESLRFCFEALVKGNELEPLALEIDWRESSDELDLAYLELDYESGSPGEKSTERERSNCSATA